MFQLYRRFGFNIDSRGINIRYKSGATLYKYEIALAIA